jgi:O-antigen/teichoic acid export membrane protein
MTKNKSVFWSKVTRALGLKIASTSLTLLTTVFLSRLLGASEYGVYAYSIAWVSLLSIPATLGLNKLIVREVAIYQTQSSWGLLRGLLRWANKTVLLTSIGLTLTAIIVACILAIQERWTMVLPFSIALISLPIISLRNIRLAVMGGLHRVVIGWLPEMLLEPLLFIIGILIISLIFKTKLSSVEIVVIYVFVTAITLLIGNCLLNRFLPPVIKEIIPQYQVKSWLTSALPLMLLGGMQIINSRIDILMLGAIKGTEAVGIYMAIIRGTQLISFILIAVNNVLAPTFASLYAQNHREQLQKVISQSSRGILFISLPIAASLIIFGHWYLLLFGSEFIQGKNALIVLSIGQLINTATGSVGVLLNMTGHERYTTISVSASALLNVIGNALLIPLWGINGAAIATTISMIFFNLTKAHWAYKKLGFKFI